MAISSLSMAHGPAIRKKFLESLDLEKYLEKSLGFFDSISKSNFDFTETSV